MTMFLDVFTPIQKGNFGLTDEAIYKSIQHGGQFIPVYGGSKEHNITERFVSEHGKTKYNEPITIFDGDGIIISLDGSSGCMTYTTSRRFVLNHHAGFFQLKKEAKQLVVPEFFSLFFEKQLQEASVSEGSKTLTLTMIESMDFDIPPFDIQEKVILKTRPLLKAREKMIGILSKIDSIKDRVLSIDYQCYQAKDVPISEVLDCYGGNTGLTEREIYQRILLEGPRYEVLSGSTSEDTRLGSIPKGYLNGGELEVLEDKEGILVIRKGKAGLAYYRKKGKYTLTDDAYFLTVRGSCAYDVNLKWLIAQYRQSFIDYSSSSDNGTWNMTGFFREVKLDIPSHGEQIELTKKYDYLTSLQIRIEGLLQKIAELLAKQVVA